MLSRAETRSLTMMQTAMMSLTLPNVMGHVGCKLLFLSTGSPRQCHPEGQSGERARWWDCRALVIGLLIPES